MDASAEDLEEREAAVQQVLDEIGAGAHARISVLNKSDRLEPAVLERLRLARPEAVFVSAQTGAGLDDLRRLLEVRLDLAPRQVRLRFRVADDRRIAGLYGAARVLSHEVDGDVVTIEAEIPGRLVERYRENIDA